MAEGLGAVKEDGEAMLGSDKEDEDEDDDDDDDYDKYLDDIENQM